MDISDTPPEAERRPCALCGADAPLKVRHVLPAFAFRWLRETSATGYMRMAATPNRRAQDGLKQPWLCGGCETLFSGFETAFATKLFHPWHGDSTLRVPYGEWLLKFCVSVSWRVLRYYEQRDGLPTFSDTQRAYVRQALARWSDFLFGRVPHPSGFEQHLLPFDGVRSTTVDGLPDNINRYLRRGLDMDIARTSTFAFTYAKLGRFMIFGFVQPPAMKWEGTKVHLREGVVAPREYVLPRELMDYVNDRARNYASVQARISEAQHDKIESAALADMDRLMNSGTFEAMMEDHRLFGEEAILRKPRAPTQGE